MDNWKYVMVSKIVIAVVLSSITAFNSYAHDSERIEQLERDVQETKQRLSILESKILNISDEEELVVAGEGWKSVANWRKLSTGMSPRTVREILGEPQRIDGGDVARWEYSNRGRVTFVSDEVHSWTEPR